MGCAPSDAGQPEPSWGVPHRHNVSCDDATPLDDTALRRACELFAQSPPFAHLAAVYHNFDWDEPLEFVKKSAGLSDSVRGGKKKAVA